MLDAGDGGSENKNTTTIAIHKNTKDKLDRIRAPGQCCNGFICHLIILWERAGEEKLFIKLEKSIG